MALEGVLARIPGLAGYLAQQQFDQQQQGGQLQQMLGVLNMVEQKKLREQEAKKSEAQLGLLTQELALKKLAEDRERLKFNTIQGILSNRHAPYGNEPSGQLPSSMDSIGAPTLAAPSSPNQSGTTKRWNPSDLEALSMMGVDTNKLIKIQEMGRPKIEVKDGQIVAIDQDTGRSQIVGTIASVNQQGFGYVPNIDPSAPGGVRITPAAGAVETYGAQQRIGDRSKAELDIVDVKMADGTVRKMTRDQAADFVSGRGNGPQRAQEIAFPSSGYNPAPNAVTNRLMAEAGANRDMSSIGAVRGAIGSPQLTSDVQLPGVSTGKTTAQEISEEAQKKTAERIAGEQGLAYANSQKAALAARAELDKIRRVDQLLGKFDGGALSQTGLQIARFANSLGIKIDKNLPNKEAAESLSKEFALVLRSSGAQEGTVGMPGNMSDSDREFLMSITPQMAQSAKGRRLIIETMTKLRERQIEIARQARQWRQANGDRNWEGFGNQMDDLAAKHPVFKGMKNEEAVINKPRANDFFR